LKVVVSGSRGWTDYAAIRMALAELPARSTIIVGGARGADTLAEEAAHHLGHVVDVYRADWDRYGKRAGYIRNALMLDQEPDLVLAFWDGESKGTLHTMKEAKRRNIPVEVIREHDQGEAT
jgi:DNA-binding MurR/RpiR family transcriptional regulator